MFNLLVDDGKSERPNRRALLSGVTKFIGIGAAPHSVMKTVTVVLVAEEFKDSSHFVKISPSHAVIATHPEISEWMSGAIAVTCEDASERDTDEEVSRMKKYWEF